MTKTEELEQVLAALCVVVCSVVGLLLLGCGCVVGGCWFAGVGGVVGAVVVGLFATSFYDFRYGSGNG